jgi:hypothetical protein
MTRELPPFDMPRKHAPKPDNPEQFKRFVETAREVGALEKGEAFERVLRKVAEGTREPKQKRRSKDG